MPLVAGLNDRVARLPVGMGVAALASLLSSIIPVTSWGQEVWQVGGLVDGSAVRFASERLATRFVGSRIVNFTVVLPGSLPVRLRVKFQM